MPQFELIPHSWLSWDFSVVQGDSVIAEIEIPRWQKKDVLKVGGLYYAAYREGFIRGAFILALDTTQLARAERTNWLSRSFTIKHGEKAYRLRRMVRVVIHFVEQWAGSRLTSPPWNVHLEDQR